MADSDDRSSPAEALERLLAGNRRFAAGESHHPRRDDVRRAELAQGQAPYAAILSCSDSRVALEIIFDQGLGDLFVVRVAGNTATAPVVVGSIEYAVLVLGCPLVMLLGHAECGAVQAALDADDAGTQYPGELPALVAPIASAVDESRGHAADTRLAATVRANVQHQVELLRGSPLLAARVADRSLVVVGAEYDLHTGRVTMVE